MTYEGKVSPTFDLFSQLAALVFRVMDNRRGGRRSEPVLLHLAPVPLLSGQHALVTFPLIKIIPGLCKVHVETACVFFVRAGAQPDTVTYTMTWKELKSVGEKKKCVWSTILIQNEIPIAPVISYFFFFFFFLFLCVTEKFPSASVAFRNDRKKKT